MVTAREDIGWNVDRVLANQSLNQHASQDPRNPENSYDINSKNMKDNVGYWFTSLRFIPGFKGNFFPIIGL